MNRMIKYNIAKLIKKSGQSYRAIARATGISHPTLLRLANANSSKDYNVTVDVLEKLCVFFECNSIEDLIEYRAPQGMPSARGAQNT